MPQFSVLLCLALLQCAFVASAPQAQPSTTTPAAQPSATILTRRQVYNCDKDWMKSIEAQAWADSGALADEAFNWQPSGQWQAAMDLFMGKNSVNDPYKGSVAIGIQGERDAHRPNTIFPEPVISVYCGDNKKINGRKAGSICKKKNKKGQWVYPFATSWVSRGWFYNDYYIVLCPRFFAEKDSLMRTLVRMDTGIINKNNASAYKFTWGHTYYHELMHLDPVVAEKETWDDAYGACNVAKLAKANGCKTGPYPGSPTDTSSLRNADSWAFFADAAYFQKAFGLKSPGQPDCNTATADEDNPESYWDTNADRTDGTFNATSPPPANSLAAPAPDGPTPVFPFNAQAATPAGLATPYADAVAYFSSLGYEGDTPSPTPTPCVVPSGCMNLATPPGCAIACS